jgi:hypothetical protein
MCYTNILTPFLNKYAITKEPMLFFQDESATAHTVNNFEFNWQNDKQVIVASSFTRSETVAISMCRAC